MAKIYSTNPSENFKLLGEVEISSESEIIEKVNKSKIAQVKWVNLTLDERINHLRKVMNLFSIRKDEISLLISREMGMPITQSKFELENGLNYFNWYLENAKKYLSPKVTFENESEIHRIFYEARWVVWVMIPWNFPFSIFIRQTIQSLLVWNSIVLKHSKETCLVWKMIEKVFVDSDFPSDVFNEVYGSSEVADILVKQDIKMICFTGSTKVWKSLYKISAEKFIPIVVELWGSAPGVVFEDVNIDETVEIIYNKRFLNWGQVCDWLKRLIVHENIYDEVVEKLKILLESKIIWISENENTDIWPLVWLKQLENIEKQMTDALSKWAKIVTWWYKPKNLEGSYYAPTLLTNISFDMQVWNEEVFWPVLPIVSFKTYDEAISLANDTEYGLWAYIFTENIDVFDNVSKDVKTWMIWLNNVSYETTTNPFWWVKNSWLWRENGEFWFHDVCDLKIVSRKK